ncbi:hypothetical protein [Paraburkholderia phenazinium]|uniref:hypothetical protein n=1 Tax=Paraburkholderia phenazinium TaxID=60549 RepID=UPI00094153E8|nr:hypothetical protein [Paraburkholderia phenazinium]
MSEFAIEKGIPVPPRASGVTWHPFGQMEVGDSVFIPVKPGRDVPRIRHAAASYGRDHGRKFTTREQSGGVRVWRVA